MNIWICDSSTVTKHTHCDQWHVAIWSGQKNVSLRVTALTRSLLSSLPQFFKKLPWLRLLLICDAVSSGVWFPLFWRNIMPSAYTIKAVQAELLHLPNDTSHPRNPEPSARPLWETPISLTVAFVTHFLILQPSLQCNEVHRTNTHNLANPTSKIN
jgi:hypothetical protein